MTFSRQRFDDFFDRIRVDAATRERDRRLLHDEVASLFGLGFGRLRLPRELGGEGLGLGELFELLVDLATADASLGHLVRGHVAFVEGMLLDGIRPGALTEEEERWVERLVRGDVVGNAQSERNTTATLTTRLSRGDDGPELTGRKYYTTGSIYADWIVLSALDGDDRVGVTVDAHQPGVESVDDWDGFGQPLTGSGTTTFDRARVDPADITTAQERTPQHGDYLAALFQLVLLAAVAGTARRAVDDVVAYVRPRERTFGFAGEHPPREDPLVQAVLGRVSSVATVARRLVVDAAHRLDAALAAERSGEPDPERFAALKLDVFGLQQVIPPLVLDAATELFEVGGASAVSLKHGLDRHWRNVRTLASHNPAIQRARGIGQWELTGTLPGWQAPGAPGGTEASAVTPAAASAAESAAPEPTSQSKETV